jgi:hypothetical protein
MWRRMHEFAPIEALAVDAGLERGADLPSAKATLVIACGALARELIEVLRLNHMHHIAVTCLPAHLHNRPERIAGAVRAKIWAKRKEFGKILCLYGDCGTGGMLDAVLDDEGVERIPGPHCYAFYAGLESFDHLMDEEIGTFFLTDYLVRFFDRLVVEGLGLDRHPELRHEYFRHYRRVVWLAQSDDAALAQAAKRAADFLELPLTIRKTGIGKLADFFRRAGP